MAVSDLQTAEALSVTAGPARGMTIDVPPAGLVLGRSMQGSAALGGDPLVSGRHAELGWTDDGQLYVRDLGSTNGTYVDGILIAGLRLLRRGDHLQVGETVLQVLGGARGGQSASYPLPTVSSTASGSVEIAGDVRADRGAVAAGRDIHGGVHTRYEYDASGLAFFTRTRGFARVLIAVGLFVALAGFASWGYPIVKAISNAAETSNGQSETVRECHAKFPSDGFKRNDCIIQAQQLSGTDFEAKPWLPLGAVLFLAGGVIMTVGVFSIRRAPDD
jgi:hypothetical protein